MLHDWAVIAERSTLTGILDERLKRYTVSAISIITKLSWWTTHTPRGGAVHHFAGAPEWETVVSYGSYVNPQQLPKKSVLRIFQSIDPFKNLPFDRGQLVDVKMQIAARGWYLKEKLLAHILREKDEWYYVARLHPKRTSLIIGGRAFL